MYQMAQQRPQYWCTVRTHLGHGRAVNTPPLILKHLQRIVVQLPLHPQRTGMSWAGDWRWAASWRVTSWWLSFLNVGIWCWRVPARQFIFFVRYKPRRIPYSHCKAYQLPCLTSTTLQKIHLLSVEHLSSTGIFWRTRSPSSNTSTL